MPLALQVLVQRYGLDGRRPRSLLEVARIHGLSRLGLRRIEGQALAALARITRSSHPAATLPRVKNGTGLVERPRAHS